MLNLLKLSRGASCILTILFCQGLVVVLSAPDQVPQDDIVQRGFCERYTVEAGESALSIAQKFHVEYEDFVIALKDCIGYEEGTFLQVGQQVCLPPYSPASEGESLETISALYNVTLEVLVQNNPNHQKIEPGGKIYIPQGGEGCQEQVQVRPTSEAVPVEVLAPKPSDQVSTDVLRVT
eukprot:jgi/Picre1/32333/NNA_007679.t1